MPSCYKKWITLDINELSIGQDYRGTLHLPNYQMTLFFVFFGVRGGYVDIRRRSFDTLLRVLFVTWKMHIFLCYDVR